VLCRPEISVILVGSQTIAELILGILEHKKISHPSFTASSLAKRAQISRSYLSEVLSGKKKISKTAAISVRSALGLLHLESGYFDAILQKELAKTENEKIEAQKEVNICLKLLQSVRGERQVPEGATLLAFDIYAAIGMFGNSGASLAQLKALFQQHLGLEVQGALKWLVAKGVLKTENENYFYTKSGLVFSAAEGSLREDFWRESLQDSVKNLGKFADEDCYFSSYSVSVQKKHAKKILSEMKKLIFEKLTELDSPEADGLMRLNIQMYPIVSLEK
jgi:uncharacterized protein (TIGR02147 family)